MDFSEIKKRIQNKDVKIIAVTKNRDAKTVDELPPEITCIGENKIQEAEDKFPHLNRNFEKHFIGHLQSNKAKKAIQLFDCIQSIDSLKLAESKIWLSTRRSSKNYSRNSKTQKSQLNRLNDNR